MTLLLSFSPQILQTLCLLPLKLGELTARPLWGSQVSCAPYAHCCSG
uniref:Uncharacterized protein n=1 Tax=Anguilla anguilla TaxID=7936 RepID=A0A0E9RVM7_ANGAN